MIKCRQVEHAVKSKAQISKPNRKVTVTEKLMNCRIWIKLSQAQNILISKTYNVEDNEAVVKMIIKRQKADNETRIPNPQSCVRLFV